MPPLSGIRVIDFGRFIAGPYCGMLLADMGADVIRVDRRQGSEDRYVAPITDGGEGPGFMSLNRNKLRRLVGSADVVIANLPIGVLKKMGLDYESLRALKPDVIMARISTFGPDGPYANRVGFDMVAQAMSGVMGLTGFPGAPVRALIPFEDYGTALHTAFGVMVALFHRAKTGEGQVVDGSLLATGVTFAQGLLAERHVLGIERHQLGNASFYASPVDAFRTRDGWIVVSVVGNDMFERWARLVGRPEFAGDPRFVDDLRRAQNRGPITEAMEQWLASRTSVEAIADLESARIPAGPVMDTREVLDDPQVQARELLQYVDYPGAPKSVPLASTPVRLSVTPGEIRHRAPTLGEHTDEVLKELGYAKEEIAALRAGRVV